MRTKPVENGNSVAMETVILVHGVGLWGWEMTLLKHRLQAGGFECQQFSYPVWRKSLSENAVSLQKFISPWQANKIHFVGHSLGGLLINQLFSDYPQPSAGRIVTLGTPYHGSPVANRLAQNWWGKFLLGECVRTALAKLSPLPPTEVGIIAGKLDIGTGWLLGLRQPNDSLITVEETILYDRNCLPHFASFSYRTFNVKSSLSTN